MPAVDKLEIIQADITKLSVDAIVNAANTSLLGGGGVDGAIHRAGGPELIEECTRLGGCRTGQAKITRAYRLPAKFVIHAVGPVWSGGQRGEAELLASCYREAMTLAIRYEVATIAFPAISCGIYGFPLEQAAGIAIATLLAFLGGEGGTIRQVLLACFDEKVFQIYSECLLQHKQSSTSSGI
ncbi:MAG: O-acetyl-ADP-ribose deacetylase [Gammaproteobacteria bacterium]